jgi:hypothetical protein
VYIAKDFTPNVLMRDLVHDVLRMDLQRAVLIPHENPELANLKAVRNPKGKELHRYT